MSFTFLLVSTGIFLVLFSVYPIVPHAPVFLQSFCYAIATSTENVNYISVFNYWNVDSDNVNAVPTMDAIEKLNVF